MICFHAECYVLPCDPIKPSFFLVSIYVSIPCSTRKIPQLPFSSDSSMIFPTIGHVAMISPLCFPEMTSIFPSFSRASSWISPWFSNESTAAGASSDSHPTVTEVLILLLEESTTWIQMAPKKASGPCDGTTLRRHGKTWQMRDPKTVVPPVIMVILIGFSVQSRPVYQFGETDLNGALHFPVETSIQVRDVQWFSAQNWGPSLPAGHHFSLQGGSQDPLTINGEYDHKRIWMGNGWKYSRHFATRLYYHSCGNNHHMVVSSNRRTPKSSKFLCRVFPKKNHPYWGTPILGNLHIVRIYQCLPVSQVMAISSALWSWLPLIGRLDPHDANLLIFPPLHGWRMACHWGRGKYDKYGGYNQQNISKHILVGGLNPSEKY